MLIETMQKRINEIKQQDRKSYYEIANEIGISESTLYNLMSKGELFTPAEQKITAYLKGYLTKDEKLEAYRLDNEELKAENNRLKEEIKEVKKYQYQQEYLDKEIEEMQKALKTLAEGLNKRQMLLQEIKEIAKRNIFLSPKLLEINGDIGQIQNIAITQILDLITKTEEEWK